MISIFNFRFSIFEFELGWCFFLLLFFSYLYIQFNKQGEQGQCVAVLWRLMCWYVVCLFVCFCMLYQAEESRRRFFFFCCLPCTVRGCLWWLVVVFVIRFDSIRFVLIRFIRFDIWYTYDLIYDLISSQPTRTTTVQYSSFYNLIERVDDLFDFRSSFFWSF